MKYKVSLLGSSEDKPQAGDVLRPERQLKQTQVGAPRPGVWSGVGADGVEVKFHFASQLQLFLGERKKTKKEEEKRRKNEENREKKQRETRKKMMGEFLQPHLAQPH